MRLWLSAIFCVVATAATAGGTFAPPGVKPPDYAITMAAEDPLHRHVRRIVFHHGDWTRVAAIADLTNETYYHDGGRISVVGSSLVIVRGPEFEDLIEYAPRNTGERETHLGESCAVWEVSRTKTSGMPGDSSIIHLSCVTDDGIELSEKLLKSHDVISSTEATQIERRNVLPEEVRPPSSAFVLDWPDRDMLRPIPPEKPDHEVVMEEEIPPGKAGTTIRIVRRHGPWQFTEETSGKQRTIRAASDYGRAWFEYASDEFGVPKRLIINRFTPSSDEQAMIRTIRPQPKSEDRTDTVLGETCHWFDMKPGIKDSGTSSCLTEDGITLRERSFARSSHREWTAIRFARRPIAIDEIKLASELLSPQLWGVE